MLDATLCVSLTRDGPDIVNVLPVPVCPYAITVPLYPFSTDSTTGPATSSYTLRVKKKTRRQSNCPSVTLTKVEINSPSLRRCVAEDCVEVHGVRVQ